jgi:hypothetical protein
MTPKEKAKEIQSKFKGYYDYEFMDKPLSDYIATEYAIILVDEMIMQWEYIDTYLADFGGQLNNGLVYWYKVREELNKI